MIAGLPLSDESNLGLRVFGLVEPARAARRTVTVEFSAEQTKHVLRLAALRAAGIEKTGADITVTQGTTGSVVRIVYDLPAVTSAPVPLLVAAPSAPPPGYATFTPMQYEFAISPFPTTHTALGLTEDEAWDTVWRRLNSAQRDQMTGHKCVNLSRNPIAPRSCP